MARGHSQVLHFTRLEGELRRDVARVKKADGLSDAF